MNWLYSMTVWASDMCTIFYPLLFIIFNLRGRRGRMVVGFTTTCAISAYYQISCEFDPRSWRCVLDTTLCDKVCQWLATGRWFSLGTLVSSTNKTDHHDITEILLKLALNTININQSIFNLYYITVCNWIWTSSLTMM